MGFGGQIDAFYISLLYPEKWVPHPTPFLKIMSGSTPVLVWSG